MSEQVNHPNHYNRAGQKDAESALKDLKKSDWYMKKYIELGGKVVKLP